MGISQPTTYKIELTSMPQNVDPTASLKRLLKAAKRGYQFRCVRVEEVKPTDQQNTVSSKPEE
jgi:hypothetical protein